ncbi:MAG: hypothetical protein ACYTGO_15700 [Planctomycetota bacterium]
MPIEEQLLPSKKLKPYYDKVVWLYVCRTFKEETQKDREALRTHDRFGISSWPQHFVFDPRDDGVLTNMPRKLEPFMASLDKVLKGWGAPAGSPLLHVTLGTARAAYKRGDSRKAIAAIEPLAERTDKFEGWLEARELLRTWRKEKELKLTLRLEDPDPRERAIALEDALLSGAKGRGLVTKVTALLTDGGQDIVVRIRALRYLASASPESVTRHAARLLRLNNDPFRYEVLALIKQNPDPQLEPALVQLFDGAGSDSHPSRNPNVVRIHTAQCLAVCGGTAAIDALAKPARECNPYNGLTRIIFESLAQIGSRADKDGRNKVVAILVDSLPQPADVAGQEPKIAKRTLRRYLYLVRTILQSLEKVSGNKQLPPVPDDWTAKDRDKLHKQLQQIFR